MKITNVHEARTNFCQILAQVESGEEVIIGKYGQPVAKLIPFSEVAKPRKLGRLSKSYWEAEDCWDSDEKIIADFEASTLFPGVGAKP